MRRNQYNPKQLRHKKQHKDLDNKRQVVKKLPFTNRKAQQKWLREIKRKEREKKEENVS